MYETQDADFAEDDLVARKCYAEGEKVADLLDQHHPRRGSATEASAATWTRRRRRWCCGRSFLG